RLMIRMADARYVVGIDLGTTNCVLAYVDTRDVAPGTESPPLAVLAVPQLTKPGVVEARAQLPSFIYLPAANEMKPESLALPWGQTEHVVGDLARARGAEVPARVVASAKSWLCSVGVDPARAILPWNAPHDVPRLSPVDAQAAYLRHLRAAWDAALTAARAAARVRSRGGGGGDGGRGCAPPPHRGAASRLLRLAGRQRWRVAQHGARRRRRPRVRRRRRDDRPD